MTLIFVSLGIGIIWGHLRPLSGRGARAAHVVTLAGLFIMLVSMGAQLGSDERVLANLGRMGLQAVVLSVFSVLGSVLMVYLARNFIYRGLDAKLTRGQRREKQ
ncbi:LysO family transporter [Desulfoscipio geothermicus]|uniref:Lysine exporter LysO n=1 Tax=Desulfoscipio geothermicus DSM 3669 TaxID=1121426 RepID=A0A1I6D157_9FIRM|nr:LysO family transporter [Desulfoscipio geothermicus]SFQ99236.1 Membrane protein of unknown function [Desulfoscipio geothermicus DSM 3669]